MGFLVSKLAPMLAKAGSSAVGQAAKQGAIAGVAGRAQNMVQGQKDGAPKSSKNENLEGWFPGRGGY